MRGLERGFERACERIGWKQPNTAAYVEVESFIIENLVKQMEQGVLVPAPVWSNIKTFNGEIVRGKIHGILGGYPCQPFSVAGQRKGSEDERHLWPYIEGIIKASGPVFCFFENVAGHLTMGFPEVYASLRNMGYAVEAGIFTAEEVGAPHERERIFILAIEMANTTSLRHRRRSEYNDTIYREGIQSNEGVWRGVRSEIEGCCRNEMANPDIIGCKHEQEKHGQLGNDEIRQHEIEKQSGVNEQCGIVQSGNSVADTCCERLEGQRNGAISNGAPQSMPSSICIDKWPAKPGQPQHEWEEPRIKSRVGFTTNGYNFREDLLRMAGNAVVEQTAEVAFIELLKRLSN
jgi:DNA (cytosine-5)-methyltransferase 1